MSTEKYVKDIIQNETNKMQKKLADKCNNIIIIIIIVIRTLLAAFEQCVP